jgi:hypothetical protein
MTRLCSLDSLWTLMVTFLKTISVQRNFLFVQYSITNKNGTKSVYGRRRLLCLKRPVAWALRVQHGTNIQIFFSLFQIQFWGFFFRFCEIFCLHLFSTRFDPSSLAKGYDLCPPSLHPWRIRIQFEIRAKIWMLVPCWTLSAHATGRFRQRSRLRKVDFAFSLVKSKVQAAL